MKINKITNIRGIKELEKEIIINSNSVFYAPNGTFKTSLVKIFKNIKNRNFEFLRDFYLDIDGEIIIEDDNGNKYSFTSNDSNSENDINYDKLFENLEIKIFDKDLLNRIEKLTEYDAFSYNPNIYEINSINLFPKLYELYTLLSTFVPSSTFQKAEEQMEVIFDMFISNELYVNKIKNGKFKKGPIAFQKFYNPFVIEKNNFSIENYQQNIDYIENIEKILTDSDLKEIFNFEKIFKLKSIDLFKSKVGDAIFNNEFLNKNLTSIINPISGEKLFSSYEEIIEGIEIKINENNENENKITFASYFETKNKVGTDKLRKEFEKANSNTEKNEALLSYRLLLQKISDKIDISSVEVKETITKIFNLFDFLEEIGCSSFEEYRKLIVENWENINLSNEINSLILKSNDISKIKFESKEKEFIFSQKIETLEVTHNSRTVLSSEMIRNNISTGEKTKLINVLLEVELVSDKENVLLLIDDEGEKFDYNYKHWFVHNLKKISRPESNVKFAYLSHNFDMITSIALVCETNNIYFSNHEDTEILIQNVIDEDFIKDFLKYGENDNDISIFAIIRTATKTLGMDKDLLYMKGKYNDELLHMRESMKTLTLLDILRSHDEEGEFKSMNTILWDKFSDDKKKVNYYDFLYESANTIFSKPEDEKIQKKLKDKITLSMGIRVFVEFALQEEAGIKNARLDEFINCDTIFDEETKELIEKSIFYCNEYNHINELILSPLIDTSMKELKDLWFQIKERFPQIEAKFGEEHE